MHEPEHDDLDDLMARVPPAPRGIGTRVLRRARVERHRVRLMAALVLDGVALASLGLLALLFGRALGSGEARELILLGIQDRGIVSAGRGEYARALAQAFPWRLLLALAIDLLAVVLLTRCLLRATDLPDPPGSSPS